MGQVYGAELAVRALRAEGVDTVFTLVGDLILSLLDAAADHDLRLVDTRHEAAAVHMADAYARVTGRPSVVLSIGGPGQVNALAGLAEAAAAESPVVHISGRAEIAREGMSAQQELDQVGVAAPITKGAWLVRDPHRIPEYVALAFRTALGGRPGPVHLTIPLDVQEQSVDEDEVHVYPPAATRHVGRQPGDPLLIDQAVALLASAERPVVVAGAAARFGVPGPALQRFVEQLRVPLFTVEHARGLVSDEHPLVFGDVDVTASDAARLIGRADVVLLLGKRLDFRIGFGRPPVIAAAARVIQVEPTPAEIGRNRAVTVGILGDLGAVIEQTLAAARRHAWPETSWLEELRAAQRTQRERDERRLRDASDRLHPLHVVNALRQRMTTRTVLAHDGGDFPQWGRVGLPALGPGRWLRLGPLGYLGASLPFGIGAKVACPDDPVVVLLGDGGVGFYFMEFDTAVRHNLAVTVIVGNDGAWGIDQEVQLGHFGRAVASALRQVRYDKLVEDLGGHGEHVREVAEIGPALDRALASGRPACVNIAVQRQRSPLAEFLIARHRTRAPGG